MKRKKPSSPKPWAVKLEIGLWITGGVWITGLLFYVMVTERVFTDPLAGVLLFVPFTMLIAAGMLHSWRNNWPENKKSFYNQLAIWGVAWISLLIKSFA